jgi:hypothetical protein
MIIEYLITNELIYQSSDKVRFIKGAHKSYAMLPPNQIRNNTLSIKALAKLNLNIDDYEKIWQQCLLPTPEISAKIEKSAITHINLHLADYISYIHRLGDANDPIAQEILKPGLTNGQIGIDYNLNTFSLAHEHILHFDNDDDIMQQLKNLCMRATNQKVDLLNNNTTFSLLNNQHSINTIDTTMINLSRPDVFEMSVAPVDDGEQLKIKQLSSKISVDAFSNEYDRTTVFKNQILSNQGGKFYCVVNMLSMSNVFLLKLMQLLQQLILIRTTPKTVYLFWKKLNRVRHLDIARRIKVRYCLFSSRKGERQYCL